MTVRSTTKQHQLQLQLQLQQHAGNGKIYRTDAKLAVWFGVRETDVPAVLQDLVDDGVLIPAGVSKHGNQIYALPLSFKAAGMLAKITQHQPVPMDRMEALFGSDTEPYRELKRRGLVDATYINGTRHVGVTGEVRL